VAAVALAFVGLASRAVYIQVIANDFYQRQGEVRFARTLPIPANRGRIIDRNGLILASSIPAPSIWAIPEDVPRDDPAHAAPAGQTAGDAAGRPAAQAGGRGQDLRLAQAPGRRIGGQGSIAELGLKGVYQRKEYKRQYPEGEATAHVVGFTNVEDIGPGRRGAHLRERLAGRAGSRRVIKDRLGQVVESVGEQIPPVDGRDLQLSLDSKVQFFAYQKLRDAVDKNKAKAGSVVVLDASPARCWRWRTTRAYVPGQTPQPVRRAAAQPRADRHLRTRLDDEADHDRDGAGGRPREPSDRDRHRTGALPASAASRSATRTTTAR
jgi:cell division protein FtsI (penicillin-binding protein 3)